MSRNGEVVARFESGLAEYCGARYCVSASNGTVTLSAALVALGVKPGERVATTALTMSATTIAILNVGAVPVYGDVDPHTWVLNIPPASKGEIPGFPCIVASLPVSLFGLHQPYNGLLCIDDAAQTLRQHSGGAFTSLSFQASKILSLGEGGALLTNDEGLAERARSYLSLGYRMGASQPRIDSNAIKSSTFERHHSYPAINGRMNDLTAAEGLRALDDSMGYSRVSTAKMARELAATMYREAIRDCDWITPQHVPDGWTHSWWTYAVACDTPERANQLADSIVKYKGERPYGCWRLAYQEPALRHLDPGGQCSTCGRMKREGRFEACPDCLILAPSCPVAESLQPRILQFQTNNLASAEQNATALRRAIEEMSA